MKKAILTICIGEPYWSLFNDYAKPTWEEYAKKYGYDIFVFEDLLDDSDRGRSRPPHWQKLVALSDPRFESYDRLVWIDSDIIINPTLAPDIALDVPLHLIGVVSDLSTPTWAEARVITNSIPSSEEINLIHDNGHKSLLEEARRLRIMEERFPQLLTPSVRKERFSEEAKMRGIEIVDATQFNSGVMVTCPREHASLFRHTYEAYENIFYPLNDNIPLIIEINRKGILHSIDSRFNILFLLELFESYPFLLFGFREVEPLLRLAVSSVFLKSFFLHFAGSYSYMPYLDVTIRHWLDLVTMGLPSELFFPNRELLSERFLPTSEQFKVSLLDVCAPPSAAEYNYAARYNRIVSTSDTAPEHNIIPFDHRLSCRGFYPTEVLQSGMTLRWTGLESYCCFAVDLYEPAYDKFLLMIRYEGSAGITEKIKVTINGQISANFRVAQPGKYQQFLSGEENFVLEGEIPDGIIGSATFRIKHPYLSKIRDTDSSDSRRLGIAITRLILINDRDPAN